MSNLCRKQYRPWLGSRGCLDSPSRSTFCGKASGSVVTGQGRTLTKLPVGLKEFYRPKRSTGQFAESYLSHVAKATSACAQEAQSHRAAQVLLPFVHHLLTGAAWVQACWSEDDRMNLIHPFFLGTSVLPP